MHIVQALASLNIGGSELVATELSEYLQARGHRVTVIARNGPLGERVRRCGATHLDWPIGRKRLSTLPLIFRLAAWLRDERPDIVHVHSRFPAWICRLALSRLAPGDRPAFVTSMHGQYTVSPYSAVMARGDAVIAVSEHIRRYTLAHYPLRDPGALRRVYGGTDPAAFPHGYRPSEAWREAMHAEFPQLAGKRLLLLPGRLSRYKGHAQFLALVAELSARHPDLHGVIVGESRPGSRYRAELEGLAERYGVLDRITFTGLRTDIRDWMASAEIVYNLCSDPPEAFGRIAPEALHLGIPVLAWNHGGAGEVLAGMFPQGAVEADNLGALIERTAEFLAAPPSVPPSEAFGLEDSMSQTLSIYQSLAGTEPC